MSQPVDFFSVSATVCTCHATVRQHGRTSQALSGPCCAPIWIGLDASYWKPSQSSKLKGLISSTHGGDGVSQGRLLRRKSSLYCRCGCWQEMHVNLNCFFWLPSLQDVLVDAISRLQFQQTTTLVTHHIPGIRCVDFNQVPHMASSIILLERNATIPAIYELLNCRLIFSLLRKGLQDQNRSTAHETAAVNLDKLMFISLIEAPFCMLNLFGY